MNTELEKLRINKDQRASRNSPPVGRWIILGLLLIGAGAGFAFWRNSASAVQVQTIRVRAPETSTADKGPVVLTATGYIMAAHKIELASKAIGRVAWVGVEMGDKVKKDDVLVRLEDEEYRARVAQRQGQLDNALARLAELQAGSRAEEIGEAQAEMHQAEAELANAEITLNRLKGLDVARTVSRQEVDTAQMVVNSRKAALEARRQRLDLVKAGPRKEQIAAAQAVVRQLTGQLDEATLDLANTTIRAPLDSTVLSRNVELGEFVTTGFVGDRGAKGYVVSLADLNDLRVELDISQDNFAKVSSKQPCWIVTDAYPDRRYEGIVDLISPEANRQKATILVRVKILSPDERLKPDMNATVSFLSAQTDAITTMPAEAPTIRIPAAAVREGAVFVVEAGKAVKRAITVGSSVNGKEIEVRKGLIGGEDLIVNPPAMLADGDAVTVQPTAK